MATVQYKLHDNYKNRDGSPFTGELPGGYVVKDGICTIPEEAMKKAGRMLELNYGAKLVQKQEAKK